MNSRTKEAAVFASLLVGFFLFAYRNYFSLGALSQGDLIPLYLKAEYYFDAFLSSWNKGNLGFAGSSTEAGFFNGVLLLMLGDNSIIAQKIIFLSTMPLACIAMFVLLGYQFVSGLWRVLISFVYGVNPLSIGLFFGGGGGLMVYYSMFPFLLLFLLNFFEKNDGETASIVKFAMVLALSASFDVQSPLFIFPFIVVLLVSNVAIRRNIRSEVKMGLKLLSSFGLFLILTLPSTASYFASLLAYFSGPAAGTITTYAVAPIPHEALVGRVTADFSYQTFDFLSASMYLTGVLAFFTLFVRNVLRLRLILSFLLLLSVGILFWQFGIKGSTLWLYETFPPLFAVSTIKLRMIFTQAFVLVAAFLIEEGQERGFFSHG